MTDLIKRLRKASGSPTLKSVLLGMFDAERTCLEAANALERMQWNTDMEAAPEDGTPYLGLWPGDVIQVTMLGKYCTYYVGEVDVISAEYSWSSPSIVDGPYAWMPLLTPPPE